MPLAYLLYFYNLGATGLLGPDEPRYASIALFAAARNLGPRVTRALIGFSSVALACFGCYLLWSGAG